MALSGTREIEDYLLGEMADEKRENFEEQLLADDDLYFEVCETENALVDRYVSESLAGEQAARFEKALQRTPALAEKVANARALRSFIASERRAEVITAEASPSIWERISRLFSFGSPAPAFAMGGLLLVFAAGLVLLLMENSRRSAEIARLEGELSSSSRPSSRESELERELANSRSREGELQQQIDGEKDIAGDLTADLARERENRRRLESEIEALRKESTTTPDKLPKSGIEPPSILAVTLAPSNGGHAAAVNFRNDMRRAAFLLTLPRSIDKSERLSVRLNGDEIARNIQVRTDAAGARSLPVTVSPQQVRQGENSLTVHDKDGSVISEYAFVRKESDQ